MAKKQSSASMSTLGSKAMRTGKATKKEIRQLGASVVGQDEKKGQGKTAAKKSPKKAK